MDKPVSDIKLACRFYQEPGGWERISSNLSSNGWIKTDRRVVKDELEIEYTVESIDGLEILLSLRSRVGFPNVETLKKLLGCLLTDCWYIDIYYCFRNINVESVAKELGLHLNCNEVKRLKLGGSEILLETYPAAGKIIVSQRVSLRDIGCIGKIYSKLLRKILISEVSQH